MMNEYNNINHTFKNADIKYDFRLVIYVIYLAAKSHADETTNA